MQKVTGIGGAFFRAKDPKALSEWYEKNLGIDSHMGPNLWRQEAGITIFGSFDENTEYFGNKNQQFMFNLRVNDLDAMMEQLKAANVPFVKELQVEKGVGRFIWIEDPEGNRIELWEPEKE